MNINNPLVSIFILCYNHEKYVSEAIESVINQTYQNIEIVIVDNASTDNSRAIIESYAMKDERIKFFPMEYNLFPSAGSNFAIKQCTGEYICGLSSDDYFELNKIDIQLKYMLSNNLSNTFTWVKVIDDNKQELSGHWADSLFNREFLPNEIEKIFITHGNTICAITWMFHKSIFEKYGYFDHRLLQTQDFDLWLRIAKNERLNLLTKKLTCYRVRDDGNNLSINMDERASLRSWFEATCYIRRVLNLDIDLLSEITGIDCNEENKYINLFEYYKNKNNIPCAVSILYEMYEKLGSSFNFPSTLYNNFFEAHSSFDFMKLINNRTLDLDIQLFIENENGFSEENSVILPVLENKEIQRFEFDLKDKKDIKSLRLDPLNDSCIIKIEKLYLLQKNGEETDLMDCIIANICYLDEGNYFFENFDPQIYFKNLDLKLLNSVEKLCIELRYNYISKEALPICYNQIITDKNNKIFILENEKMEFQKSLSSLNNELSLIHNSKSWKIMQVFKKIARKIISLKKR